MYNRLSKTPSSINTNSQAAEQNPKLGYRAFGSQIQKASVAPVTQTDIEDEAFAEQKFEATGLELQAKYAKITPEGQERLTVLQAKMDELLNSPLERATRFSHNFANIPIRSRDTATPIQAKLTIGEPGDKYEQEADETARQVVQRIHQLQSDKLQGESLSDEELQMKPMVQRRVSKGGMAATQDLEASINQARGGGQPLAKNIRKPMELGFGADFSRVKVHTDTRADQLNRSIQAKAFTTGQDVFFRQGAYQPGSRGGQELLAHELTHVVQQSGGVVQDAGAVQQNGNAVQPWVIQREVVKTMGGSWKTNRYRPALLNTNPGAEIELEFTPNKLVDSKKIALLQTLEKIHNGTNLDEVLANKRRNNERLIGNSEPTKASRTEGNGHWDRVESATNPVYGAPNLEAGEPLSNTAKSKLNMNSTNGSNYQLGYRYRTLNNLVLLERSAKLHDKPNMPSAKSGSRMIFETTAMSLEGEQENVFYGSVKWGWKIDSVADRNIPQDVHGNRRRDPDGKILPDTDGNVALRDITLEPLAMVQMGTPSAEMKDLAHIWNQATTYTHDAPEGIPNTAIPTINHDTTTLAPHELRDPARIQQKISILEDQLKVSQPTNDQRNKQFELKFLKKKLKKLQ